MIPNQKATLRRMHQQHWYQHLPLIRVLQWERDRQRSKETKVLTGAHSRCSTSSASQATGCKITQWCRSCPYHADAKDPQSTRCTRTLHFEGYVESGQTIEKLKRWALGGRRVEHRADPKASSHKHLRDSQLKESQRKSLKTGSKPACGMRIGSLVRLTTMWRSLPFLTPIHLLLTRALLPATLDDTILSECFWIHYHESQSLSFQDHVLRHGAIVTVVLVSDKKCKEALWTL